MDKKMKNTTYDFTLENGSVVQLTLNFYYLYQLRNKHKELYGRYNKIMNSMNNAKKNDDIDFLDMVTICYVGYMCANMEKDDILTEEEFYYLCGSNVKAVGETMAALIAPKKQ